MTVRVGLLDSGAGLAVGPALVADRAFQLDGSGKVIARESQNPANDHGSQLAELLLDVPEPVGLLSANVFTGGQVSSPTVIAAGLNWLVENGAQVVNMSFGLANDRPVLSEACHNADRENVILVAAGPARGEPVYPAAYPDVLAITGDARCTSEELSRQPMLISVRACMCRGPSQVSWDRVAPASRLPT